MLLTAMPENGNCRREIFFTYLRLGCVCFGGPAAHLGYFREEFVTRRKWLDEGDYAELIALCQSLPGPSSSQLGFAIGWWRGGFAGALLAWLGFTLPSAVLMLAAAYGLFALGPGHLDYLDGFLIAAVAVVAKAVLGMAPKLCPDPPRVFLALLGTIMALMIPGGFGQLGVVCLGVAAGMLFLRKDQGETAQHSLPAARFDRKITLPAVLLFGSLLALASLQSPDQPGALFAMHYQAGALVFGGGHVVLPLLDDSIVANGLISETEFLAGYGAAQLLPGPLFAISAFTGTVGSGHGLGGCVALVAIFLPGLLLVAALLPTWRLYRRNKWAQAGLAGVNAVVVGLLLAALITPVWARGIQSWGDAGIALLAFIALQYSKLPAWAVVIGCAIAGLAL